MKKILIAVLLAVLFFSVNYSNAEEDFGTALGMATMNVPSGADSASMGGATTAAPEFSSNNPAIVAAGQEFKIGSSLTYARIGFKSGPDINVYAVNVSGKLPVGVFQISYSDVRSGAETTLMDADAKFNSSPSLSVLYGLKVKKNLLISNDELYLGVSYSPLQKSRLTFSLDGENVLQSKSDGYAYGAGALYKPTKALSIGAYYSRSRSNEEEYDFMFDEATKEVSESEQIRLGIGCQVTELTFIAVDYQHLNIDGAKKDQLFAGIEQGIIKDLLYVYGGFAGSFKSPTAGVGVYFKNGGLNIAYMNNPFDNLKPYLGKAEIVMATGYISF